MCTYIYVYVQLYIQVYVYVHIYTYMYIYIIVLIPIHTSLSRLPTQMYVHLYLLRIHIFIPIYVCVNIFIYLHIQISLSIDRLPTHMSLAQVLFYSTMAVKKIRNFIKKYDNCTLIPCTLSGYEKKISNLLNVPLLSPDPSVGGKIGSRSIMKKVFIDLNVNIPIGAHDISTISDFYTALSALVKFVYITHIMYI
jgi:hypothetical protein